MTPAGELRAAAAKLRAMAATATWGPWTAGPEIQGLKDVDGPTGEKVCQFGMDWPCMLTPDAEWIALMDPATAPGIAALLEHYAECVAWSDNWDVVHNFGKPIKQFARAVLGEKL